jgi:hypothetical protein
MGIIHARKPQMLARQRVECAARSARREDGAGQSDMAFKDAGEAVLDLCIRRAGADPDGAGDVGGAVGILPARSTR